MGPQCPSAWQLWSAEHGLLAALQGAWQMRLWLQSQGLGSTSQIWDELWQSPSRVQVVWGTWQMPQRASPGLMQLWPLVQVEEVSHDVAPLLLPPLLLPPLLELEALAAVPELLLAAVAEPVVAAELPAVPELALVAVLPLPLAPMEEEPVDAAVVDAEPVEAEPVVAPEVEEAWPELLVAAIPELVAPCEPVASVVTVVAALVPPEPAVELLAPGLDPEHAAARSSREAETRTRMNPSKRSGPGLTA